RKGAIFMDILIALFLLGLGTITVFPILNTSFKGFSLAGRKAEMVYAAETVAETIMANRDELEDLFIQLEEHGEVDVTDLLTDNFSKYKCQIINTEDNEYLWNIKIIVNYNGKESISDVELQASIPKK